MDENEGLPPLQRLLVAHARRADREWDQLVWMLDQRLAAVVRGVGEPMIALIRMAWWEEALVERDMSKGKGEPLVEAWRAHPLARERAPWAARLIDGWRVLLEAGDDMPLDLRRYAEGRGTGVFGLIGEESGARGHSGPIWALWDLAGHVRDVELASAALRLAGDLAEEESGPVRGIPRSLRLSLAVALPDVRAGRIPAGFSPRHYLRLLRGSLFA